MSRTIHSERSQVSEYLNIAGVSVCQGSEFPSLHRVYLFL